MEIDDAKVIKPVNNNFKDEIMQHWVIFVKAGNCEKGAIHPFKNLKEEEKNEILLQLLDADTPLKNNCTPDDTMNKDVPLYLQLKLIFC